MKKFTIYTLFTFLLAIIFYSCDNPSTSSETGTLRVSMTDAPANYDAIYIDIREVLVNKNEDTEEEDNGWEVVNDEQMTINLLDLTNGKLEVLGDAELTPGTYHQIRLALGDNNQIVIDGETHKLTTPSAQQSGLKLNIDAEVESGQVYHLLLDFDASRSIVVAGITGNYILKPVIRAISFENTGAISGTVEPAEALPWVYTIAGEDTVSGTQANEEGEFLMIGILGGTYQISVKPSAESFSSVVLSNIEVTATDTTVLDTIALETQ